MDPIVRKTLLYDFYGELLTEHQKTVFESSVFQDLSYSEIAGELKISRQAVYDLLHRSEKLLEDYEKKLGLVERFLAARESFRALSHEIDTLTELLRTEGITEGTTHEILRERLQELKDRTVSIQELLV